MNKNDTFYNNTYGFLEARGMTAMISAIDNMLKGASIELLNLKRYGSAYMTVVIKGSNDDILNAIKIGEKSVNKISSNISSPAITQSGLSQLISTHIISQPLLDLNDTFFNKPPGTDTNDLDKSIALLDARGLIALIAAADKMTKSTPVEILGYQQMGSGRLSLITTGNVTAIKHAINIGINEIKKHGKLIGYSVITNPHPRLKQMMK